MKYLSLSFIFVIISCTSSPTIRFTGELPKFKETPVSKVRAELFKYRIKYNDHNIFKDSFTATVNEKDYELKKLKRLILHVDKSLNNRLKRSYKLKKYRDWSLNLTLIPILLFLNSSKTVYLATIGLGAGGYIMFDNKIKRNNAMMFENYNRKLEKNYFYYKVNF
jgi:hypothetical protein